MADIGLINFIKNALANGQTKEVINETLLKNNWQQPAIDEAFAAVANPVMQSAQIHTQSVSPASFRNATISEQDRPTMIIALCGYYFISLILSFINVVELMLTNSLKINFNLYGTVGEIISFVGIWYMRKWGAYLYFLIVIASLGIYGYIYYLAGNELPLLYLLPFPIIATFILVPHLGEMS